jgi:hypothetical protein
MFQILLLELKHFFYSEVIDREHFIFYPNNNVLLPFTRCFKCVKIFNSILLDIKFSNCSIIIFSELYQCFSIIIDANLR